ncbi:MAG: MBL fold metallo-hydrolase [Planctomycetes bacterium]|nr:MBL fold metallo-hydrolase [Planctomycetota bacterium]
MILLGTGTSVGVPVVGCDYPVCTSTNPRNHRTRTGVAVATPRGTFLIDTPPELRLQLVRERIPLVEAVLYTHGHADHVFGLDDLRICGHRLERAIPLYCEANVEAQLRSAFSYAFEPPDPTAHKFAIPLLEFHRIVAGRAFEVLGQWITPIRLQHGRLPVLGFRLNDVAFCTDVSSIPEDSWPLLQGLDVLVLDALREKPHPTHLSIPEALEVVDRVRPRRTYFTHISHWLEHEATNARLPEGVELAYDGLRLRFA